MGDEVKTVQLGIIGLGYVGQIHLRNCLRIPNAEVFAVADVSKKALNNAKKVGVKNTFENYSEMLNEPDIDAVIIGLPTHLHLKCVVEAAEAGKGIFLEKPMARNIEEAKEVISVTERNSVKLMIGYPFRFNKPFNDVKEKMEQGQLGDVENAYATYVSTGPFFHRAEGHAPVPVPDWWFNRELTGGGVLMDLGSHLINLLRWYFGEITSIQSHLGYRFNMDFEDSAMCLARFKSRTVALINVGWFSQEYAFKLDFLGSVRNLSVENSPFFSPLSRLKMLITGKNRFLQAHVDEMQYFVNCVAGDLDPSPSGQDGLRDIEAINLAYKNQISLP
jgi:predicted dehydrogenase